MTPDPADPSDPAEAADVADVADPGIDVREPADPAGPAPALTGALRIVLERSQDVGFLGPGPLGTHVSHAIAFAGPPSGRVVEAPARFLDLGSGGGLPGLVLATLVWPEARVTLLDAGQRRCDFLTEAVEELGIDGRVTVVRGRAEEAGRAPDLRAAFDLVVARSFGPPAVTAECAAPFLRLDGALVVSDPPDPADDRWPSEGVAMLGLTPESVWTDPYAYRSFRQSTPCPDRYPRRVGVPAKRPLF